MGLLPSPADGLRSQPRGIRIGLTSLVLVLLGGLWASGVHLLNHYQNRDELPGFSLDDIRGAYHGIDSPGLFGSAIERGHPETLPTDQRQILLEWLAGGRIVEDYDSLDLEIPPAEIIDQHCVECHSRAAGAEAGTAIPPLEYFDDIREIAFSRTVLPTPVDVLAASTHAHALALSVQGILVAALVLLTRWPRACRRQRSRWCCLLRAGPWSRWGSSQTPR